MAETEAGSPGGITGTGDDLTMDAATEDLLQVDIAPLETKQFRLHGASAEDAQWPRDTLGREWRWLGVRLELTADNSLRLRWG